MFKKYFLLALAILLPVLLSAKVNRFSFSDLVENSDLILLGEAFSISYNDDYSGEAKLKVISVLKGNYHNEYITYSWDASPHSRGIDRAVQKYVIFVKKDQGDFISAVHGAGIWNVYLDTDDIGKSIVVNDFVLELPDSLHECVRFCDDAEREMKITLNAFFSFFNKELDFELKIN